MIIAVFIYNEVLDFYKIISFALIWISLAIAATANLRRKNDTK
jgi:chloramphenicol-sensitive protein RarD